MSKKATLTFMYVMIFLFAFGFIMYSAVMPAIRENYTLDMAQAGLIGSCLSAGQFVILLFNDLLSRHFTKMQLIFFCYAANLASMALIAVVPPYIALLAAYFTIGMAISLVNVVMSAQISDMFGDERDRYLNYFHGIYGVGSMAGPLLPSLLTAINMPWTASYIAVSVIGAAMGLFFVKVDMGSVKANAPSPGESSIKLLKDKRLVTVCLATLFFIGMDMTICSWISSYLVDVLQMSEAMAGLSVTVYWIGSAAGRMIYPIAFSRIDSKKYLLAANLAAAALFCGAIATCNGVVIYIAMGLIGFISGVSFPLLIGMGCALHPDSAIGATNDVSIAGSIGGTVFPNLTGVLGTNMGYTGFVAVVAALFIGVAALMGILIRMTSVNRKAV